MLRKLYVGLVLIGVIAITVSCNGSRDELSKEVIGNNSISTESSRAENNKINENGTESNLNSPSKNSYRIVNETYNNKGTKINYPQITELSDAKKQKEINEIIKNEALKGNNYYKDVDGEIAIDINYKRN